MEIDTSALGGDLVIVRSDGSPLYHFTVVVDDAAMAMTHIIRGEDHLSNTPKHILLFRALGATVPQFAHLPLILNADRSKMSKRKSQTAMGDYIAQGFVREGLVNYLALLGWASTGTDEMFSLDELTRLFDLDRVHQGGAVFDRDRLEWLNGQWIRRLSPEELVERVAPFLEADLAIQRATGRVVREPTEEDLRALVPLIQERLPTLAAVGDITDFLFIEDLVVEPGLLVPEALGRGHDPGRPDRGRHALTRVGEVAWDAEEIEPPLRALAEARGWKAGDLFMAIRVAVTGRTATPPLFDTLVVLGPSRTLARLDAAREALAGI